MDLVRWVPGPDILCDRVPKYSFGRLPEQVGYVARALAGKGRYFSGEWLSTEDQF